MSTIKESTVSGLWHEGCEAKVIDIFTDFIQRGRQNLPIGLAMERSIDPATVAAQLKSFKTVASAIDWATDLGRSGRGRYYWHEILLELVNAGVLAEELENYSITLLAEQNYQSKIVSRLGLAEELIRQSRDRRKVLTRSEEPWQGQLSLCLEQLTKLSESGRKDRAEFDTPFAEVEARKQELLDCASSLKLELSEASESLRVEYMDRGLRLGQEREKLSELLERVQLEKQNLLDILAEASSATSTAGLLTPTSTVVGGPSCSCAPNLMDEPTLVIHAAFPGFPGKTHVKMRYSTPMSHLIKLMETNCPFEGVYRLTLTREKYIFDSDTPASLGLEDESLVTFRLDELGENHTVTDFTSLN